MLLINSILQNFPFYSIVALKIYGLVILLDISKILITDSISRVFGSLQKLPKYRSPILKLLMSERNKLTNYNKEEKSVFVWP